MKQAKEEKKPNEAKAELVEKQTASKKIYLDVSEFKEIVCRVKNNTGASIPKGAIVHLSNYPSLPEGYFEEIIKRELPFRESSFSLPLIRPYNLIIE